MNKSTIPLSSGIAGAEVSIQVSPLSLSLRELKAKRKWTMAQLATALNANVYTVKAWIAMTNEPRMQLQAGLNRKIAELMNESPQPDPSPPKEPVAAEVQIPDKPTTKTVEDPDPPEPDLDAEEIADQLGTSPIRSLLPEDRRWDV